MVWMSHWRSRAHVLRTAQAVLICAGRNRTAFGDRRTRGWNIPDNPVRYVVVQTAGRNGRVHVMHDEHVAHGACGSSGPTQLRGNSRLLRVLRGDLTAIR